MQAQYLSVVLLVPACAIYALWVLLPAVARRLIAKQLLQLPLAPRLKAPLLRAAATSSGCNCSGCDKVAVAAPDSKAQPLRFHPPTKSSKVQ